MKPNAKALKTRLAVRHIRAITKAISESVNVQDIVDAWFSTHHGEDMTVTTEQGRDWARIHVIVNTQPMRNTLANLYADSIVLGMDLSSYQIARKAKLSKAATNPKPSKKQLQNSININWNKWKPGNRAAALRVRPNSTMYDLLNRGKTTADEITTTTVKRIGKVLADSLNEGLKPSRAAELIDELIDDPARALTIAQTETSYAVVQASLDLYEDLGVEMIEYLVADPCDECQENLDASPIPLGEEWPNGDPPVHPNCMCDVAPYVVDTQDWAWFNEEE